MTSFLRDRLGLGEAWRAYAVHPVGVRLRHVLAPLVTYLFVQQAVLGIALATYYSPSATDAWASTAYLQDQVTLGWFVRGLHYHGASAFVIVVALWLAVAAFTRAYRRPYEPTWVAILVLVGLALAFGITGNPLPWDQPGYWGIQVELGIIEQTPGGEILRRLLQGGSDAGNLTVLRLYALHVFVLPLVAALVLGVVWRQLRLHGLPAPETTRPVRVVAYFPAQAFVDVLAIAMLAAVLVGLTVSTHGAELFGPADPTANFQARPEWYFMFLYKLRMFFEGPMEPIATVVIPGAAATFLVAVPLLDRLAGPWGRIVTTTGVAVLMTAVVALTGLALVADRNDEAYQKALSTALADAERARGFAREGVVPHGGPAVFWNDPEFKVRQLYAEHCQSCHALDGEGGEEAPDLTGYGSREWLKMAIRDVNQPRFLGNTRHKGDMEAYPEDKLPTAQLDPLVEYLLSITGDLDFAPDETLVQQGKALWADELDCNNCHEVEKGEEGEGPNMWGRGNADWLVRVIRDSGQPDLFGSEAEMPKFAGKLSDEEIQTLAQFIWKQRETP